MPSLQLIQQLAEAAARAVDAMLDRVEKIEPTVKEIDTRERLREAYRDMRRAEGKHPPSTAETDEFVDRLMQRYGTYERKADVTIPESEVDAILRGAVFEARRADGSVAWTITAADLDKEAPTHDAERRLAAHAKHLQGLEQRLKRLERGAS